MSQSIVNGKPLFVSKVERHIIEPSGFIHQTLTVLTLRGKLAFNKNFITTIPAQFYFDLCFGKFSSLIMFVDFKVLIRIVHCVKLMCYVHIVSFQRRVKLYIDHKQRVISNLDKY